MDEPKDLNQPKEKDENLNDIENVIKKKKLNIKLNEKGYIIKKL